jgi:hypothetical protein
MAIERFREWMEESTIAEKKLLALRAKTALSLLYQLGYGTRNASADLAARVAKGIEMVNSKPRHKPLPEVLRGDLCETCAKCSYYKECEK